MAQIFIPEKNWMFLFLGYKAEDVVNSLDDFLWLHAHMFFTWMNYT